MYLNIKIFAILLSFSLLLTACGDSQSTQVDNNDGNEEVQTSLPTLIKKWETDTLLTTCESVLYDKAGGFLYVANINGNPRDKDGNGFISKVSLDGEILEEKFATGLDAPKGMGKTNGKLYVTDIDRVIAIDISTGEILQTWPIEGAGFLNDISTNEAGNVWISDSATGSIHLLSEGAVSIWVQSDSLKGPNGLLVEKNRILHVTFEGGELFTFDMVSKVMTKVADGLTNGDGVVSDGKGNYLISGWNGQIFFLDKDWKKTQLLDTREAKIAAADIEFIADKNLLLIPTFFGNTVVAYELK